MEVAHKTIRIKPMQAAGAACVHIIPPMILVEHMRIGGSIGYTNAKVAGTIIKTIEFNSGATKELYMKIATTMLVVGALFAGTALAQAAGVSEKISGDQMQDKGSVKGGPGHLVILRVTRCRRMVR